MGSETRRRKNKLEIRLDDDELEAIRTKASRLGKTPNAYLRDLALGKKVKAPLIDKAGALEIARQIRLLGKNVNQLAHLAHKGLQVVDLDYTRKELKRLRQLLNLALLGRPIDSSTTANQEPSNGEA